MKCGYFTMKRNTRFGAVIFIEAIFDASMTATEFDEACIEALEWSNRNFKMAYAAFVAGVYHRLEPHGA